MAMVSSPVMRFVHGCANAGMTTMITPSRPPPTSTTSQLRLSPKPTDSTTASRIDMNTMW